MLSSATLQSETALFRQIEALALKKHNDPFTFQKLKSNAQALLKQDAVMAYTVLGAIASKELDIQAIHANYQKALNTSPSNPMVLDNYGIALAKVGYFAQAVELMAQAFSISPLNLSYLDHLIRCSLFAGQFHQLTDRLNTWNTFNPNEEHEYAEFINDVIQFMDEKAVTDADLENLIHLVMSILHNQQIYVPVEQIALSFSKEEDDPCF